MIKFTNCRLFSTATGRLVSDDLWVRNGCVINPVRRAYEGAERITRSITASALCRTHHVLLSTDRSFASGRPHHFPSLRAI